MSGSIRQNELPTSDIPSFRGMSYSPAVSMDWQSTAEGETILQHLYNPQNSGRKFFGLLERPAVPSNVEEVSYKLFVVGSSGVGKTATVARLAGLKCSNTYYETSGIQKTNVYWPVKIWDKIIMFKLQFWDSGKNCIKKYGHILSSCQSQTDALVFVFSFMKKSTLTDLPKTIGAYVKACEDPAVVAIGTRFKSPTQLEVTQYDVKEFEMKMQIPVLKIENKWTPGRNEVHDVAPVLNMICERLWMRDQDYLYKHGMVRDAGSSPKKKGA
ncbi:hypothetical protein RUM43_004278 [Polyplax serrata]|uniref:Ciliogenesis and planar polarity effector 2 n=1 Tax=Polyplax serrata TaxID=468196 RepID=A0AAN8XMX1_POLSC